MSTLKCDSYTRLPSGKMVFNKLWYVFLFLCFFIFNFNSPFAFILTDLSCLRSWHYFVLLYLTYFVWVVITNHNCLNSTIECIYLLHVSFFHFALFLFAIFFSIRLGVILFNEMYNSFDCNWYGKECCLIFRPNLLWHLSQFTLTNTKFKTKKQISLRIIRPGFKVNTTYMYGKIRLKS